VVVQADGGTGVSRSDPAHGSDSVDRTIRLGYLSLLAVVLATSVAGGLASQRPSKDAISELSVVRMGRASADSAAPPSSTP
jgi:hypothetical protein